MERPSDPGTICPFCGKDVAECFGGSGNEPCDHLVADWTRDPYDNGGGVLGEGQSDNAALRPAGELGLAGSELVSLLIGEGDESRIKDRYSAFLTLLPSEPRPPWWSAVVEVVAYQVDVEELLGQKPEELASFATPVTTAIIETVPSVAWGAANIGGMASSDVVYVWSTNRTATTDEIIERIHAATQAIKALTAELAQRL